MNTVQREITVDQTPLCDLSQMVLEMNDVVAHEMRERRRMVLGEESPRQLMQVVPCSWRIADVGRCRDRLKTELNQVNVRHLSVTHLILRWVDPDLDPHRS